MDIQNTAEKAIKKRLKRNKKLSLMGFVVVTASAIVAFYTFPSLSTAGWIAIIFAIITALCWFLPLAMAAAEMATVKGWTHGGIFTWVRNMLGPRMGFMVNWLQFQVTLGFVAMIFFCLTSFGFSFAGVEGYNFINSLKFGTTFNQPSNINYSHSFNRTAVMFIGLGLLVIIMGLSLLGQHKTHKLGQFGFTAGILLPFLIVTGFSIYTIATMDDPLALIGKSFQKSHHFDLVNMGSSYLMNKQFMTSTVMASFMAFMFSLHGVEVSAIAANRMKNPSKMYPKAMSIVVALALICAILGSITISMTVPTSTLSFTGGTVQSMIFTMSVEGVTVNGIHYNTLAEAYAKIESLKGPVAAEAMFNQYIYGVNNFNENAIDPITGMPIFTKIKVSSPSNALMGGIQTLSFFAGIGVFVEIAVWTSNLSNGLCYAMEKQHFNKVVTYRLKNGSPLTVTLFNIVFIMVMFSIFTYSYAGLDSYMGKSLQDVLTQPVNNVNFAGLNEQNVNKIREILKPLYHTEDGFQSYIKHNISSSEVQTALAQIKNITGFEVVASGIPASETNIAFISNVIMQISTYFVGYTIFLISYIKFAIKGKHLDRQFKIKWRWLQITFAILAMCTTLFAAVATYLPAAPELYPGKEVYFNFLAVSLPCYIIVVFIGLFIYEMNRLRLKKLNLNISENRNVTIGSLEQLDLNLNYHFYWKTANHAYLVELELNIEKELKLLNDMFKDISLKTEKEFNILKKQITKKIHEIKKHQKQFVLRTHNVKQYREMIDLSNKLNELYILVDDKSLDPHVIDGKYAEIEAIETALLKKQTEYYRRNL